MCVSKAQLPLIAICNEEHSLSHTHTHTHNTPRFILLQVIELSATAKLPIIAICNEENSPKIRSLASKCLKIRFYRPRPWQLLPRRRHICMYVHQNTKSAYRVYLSLSLSLSVCVCVCVCVCFRHICRKESFL